MTTRNSGNNNNGLHPWDNNPGLKKLCELLRNEGHRVLNGTSAFTLTTEVLAKLNGDCKRHSILENDISATDLVSTDRSFLPFSDRLRAQQEAYRSKAEWNGHIQFIKDFLLSTPNLKLIRYSGTISCPISLHYFGNLTSLNLRKVPIHMVEGLQKLRATLTTIAVYRSVDKVKDLLEFCGGDMSAPMTWPQLKFVSFMFNSISSLDDSFRLLPHAEVLDLSHNSLETCDKFLEYLGDVQRLTLAYNFLTRVPSVSMTTRATLVCLVLRGNNLDNINDLEVLTAIQDLDLGENCISDHNVLGPLGALIKLQQLQLDGNPLFYHKRHRSLTVKYLAWQVVHVQFELDKKKLTAGEISGATAVKGPIKRITPHQLNYPNAVEVRGSMPDSDYHMSPSSGIGTENESTDRGLKHVQVKTSRRKRAKARDTEILDLENSGDFSSSRDVTPGTSPHPRNFEQQWKTRREEAIKTQKEIEELRKHYGPNWLQAIEDKDIFNKKKTASATYSPLSSDTETRNFKSGREGVAKFTIGYKSSSDPDTESEQVKQDSLPESYGQPGNGKLPTEDDLYLTDVRMNDANKPIMAAIARMAAGHSASDTDGENKLATSSNVLDFDCITNHTSHELQKSSIRYEAERDRSESKMSQSSSFSLQGTTVNGFVSAGNITIQSPCNKNFEKLSHSFSDSRRPISAMDSISHPPEPIAEKQNVIIVSSGQVGATAHNSVNEHMSTSEKPSNFNHSSSTAKINRGKHENGVVTSTSDSLEEEKGAESVFATLPLQNNEMVIVTLTSSFLLEKDIQGKLQEKLELASLISLEWKNVEKVDVEKSGQTENNSEGLLKSNEAVISSNDKKEMGGQETDVENMQLDLRFDYVRKDRRSRCYIVDSADGKIILAHLQPFLDSREDKEKAKSSVVMQCLKCNRTFLKSELVHKKQELPTSGSSKDLLSYQELIDRTIVTCPKCGSSIVIEIESPSSSMKPSRSVASMPTGFGSSSTKDYMGVSSVKKKCPDNTSIRLQAHRNSFDSSSGQKGKHSNSLVGVYGSETKDIQSRLQGTTASRDRSSAFIVPPKMSASLQEEHITKEDELVCIEDHFSADAIASIHTSSQLAEMTSSLQGDSSTRGFKAHVRRQSLKESQTANKCPEPAATNIGFNNAIINTTNKQTNPVTLERNIGKKLTALADQEVGDKEENLRSWSRKASLHKNLATMEDIVNSMVNEGKYLEEEESLSSSSYSSNKGRSVSITTFMKSSSYNNRKMSISSVEGGDGYPNLRHSESSSSISVIPIPPSVTSVEAHSNPATFSSSLPITFRAEADTDNDISVTHSEKGEATVTHSEKGEATVTQSVKGEATVTHSEKGEATVVSLVSSSTCSNIVSSVYETSVNNQENDNGLVNQVNEKNNSLSVCDNGDGYIPTDGRVIIVGSSSSSSEDLTSIYDHPRKPKSSSKKKSHSKEKSSSITSVKSSDTNMHLNESACVNVLDQELSTQEDSGIITHVQPVNQLPSLINTTVHTQAVSDSAVDEDDAVDDFNDEDVVPQYAFHHLNHRLMLYMMMFLFGPDEEFICKMQAEIVQYIIEKPYQGILVMSSERFYILKIISDDHSQTPDQWLHCTEIQPIPELRYVDVGLGGQSLRLEFLTDCSSYTIITRNRDKTSQFVEILHTNLAKYAVSQGIVSQVVVNDDVDQMTLDNLNREVVSKISPDQKLLHYCMGFIERGNQTKFPVSFVITSSDICLVCTNHQWPQPRLQAPVTEETVGKQFTVLERQKVSNVASVKVCEATMKKIQLEHFAESEGVSSNWNITLATRQSTVDFINALSDPWAKEFGVEMDVTYEELSF